MDSKRDEQAAERASMRQSMHTAAREAARPSEADSEQPILRLAAEDRQRIALDALEQARQAVAVGRLLDATRHAARALEAIGTDLHLTMGTWPICPRCEGYGEIALHPEAPNVDERRVRCEDRPDVCPGNRYGRMHPEQYAEWCARTAVERGQVESLPPPIHDSEDE